MPSKIVVITVIFLILLVTSSFTMLWFVMTGNRPKCIVDADLGYGNDNRGWYKHKHPWKKNTFCRDVHPLVVNPTIFVCNTDDKNNSYVVASTIGISSADKHDRISAKNPLPSVC